MVWIPENEPGAAKDPEYLIKFSAQLEQKGDITAAWEALRKAILINPSFPMGYWKKFEQLSARAGKQKEAVFYDVMFDSLIPGSLKFFNMDSVPELFGKGLKEYFGRTGSREKAKEYFHRVREHGNLPQTVWLVLYSFYKDMGMAEVADQCRAEAERNSENYPALLPENRSVSGGLRTPDTDPAEWHDPWFEKTDDGANNLRDLIQKGYLFYHKKFPSEAVVYFDRALSLAPLDYNAYLSLHSGYIVLGHVEKSQTCINRAFNLIVKKFGGYQQNGFDNIPTADYHAVWEAAKKNLAASSEKNAVSCIALVLYQNRNYKEALPLVTRTSTLDPTMDHIMMLCDCYLHLGELDKAREILDPEALKYPDNYIILAQQAKLLNRTGDYPDALESAGKGIAGNKSKSSPYFENCCEEKAYALWKLGRPEEAIDALEPVPENALETHLFILKGDILDRLGRYTEAIACFDHILALNKSIAHVIQRKGECLERAGRTAEARECFEQVSCLGLHYKNNTNRYNILKRIGMGGLGTVSLGYDTAKACFVALKTYRDEFATSPAIQKQFRKEAEIWVRLGSHPNIVRAQDIEVIDDRLYVVMDYIPSGKSGKNTLEERLREREPDLHQVLDWAIQICRGMEHAYASGITCHRDIKPANIMIGPDNVAKITDFGLADAFRFTGPVVEGVREITDQCLGASYSSFHGKCAGTPTHMPPEQFTEADKCDVRSDIYSFGIVLFQMISRGSLPYPVRHLMERQLANQQMFAEFFRLHMNIRSTIPSLDSPFMPVILNCLQPDRALRYQSFAMVKSDLKKIMGSLNSADMNTDPGLSKEIAEEDHFQKANGLMKLGHYRDAAALFDAIISRSPRNFPAWFNRGICFEALHNFEESLRCYHRLIEINPGEIAGWERIANGLYKLERLDECMECCTRILEQFQRSETVSYLQVRITMQKQGNDAALPLIKRALELYPENCNLWIAKGLALQPPIENQNDKARYPAGAQDRIAETLQCYEEALRRDPKNPYALMHKALALNASNRSREAIPFFDQAIKADPTLADAWGGKAIALAELGRLDDAIACCDNGLMKNNSPQRIRDLRDAYAGVKSKLDSESSFEKDYYRAVPMAASAPEESPQGAGPAPGHQRDDLAAAVWKGRTLVLAGKRKEAVSWFSSLIQKDPVSDILWVERGVALGTPVRFSTREQRGFVTISTHNPHDVYEAIRCFEKAAEINPRCIEAYVQMGILFYDHLDFTEAHAALDKALSINPQSVPALKGKAMTYAEAARFSEAVEYCDRCLQIDSSRQDIKQLRQKYETERNKPGQRGPLPGINFRKQFPEPGAKPKHVPQQSPVQKPLRPVFTAEIRTFRDRFFQCFKPDGRGTLTVDMGAVTDLVKENPERARQFVSWCCSDQSMPLNLLQMVGFAGVAIQMLYGDSGALDMIGKRVEELRGKTP